MGWQYWYLLAECFIAAFMGLHYISKGGVDYRGWIGTFWITSDIACLTILLWAQVAYGVVWQAFFLGVMYVVAIRGGMNNRTERRFGEMTKTPAHEKATLLLTGIVLAVQIALITTAGA